MILHFDAVFPLIILYFSEVSSVILYSDFTEHNYPRICTIEGYDNTNTCRKIAELDDIKKDAYSNIDDVRGECQTVFVELLLDILDANKMIRGKAKIVLCDVGPDNKKCASASTDDNVIEYYNYEKSDESCVHIGSMNLSGSTTVTSVEDMEDTSTPISDQEETKKKKEKMNI